jgi:hypothetical protein
MVTHTWKVTLMSTELPLGMLYLQVPSTTPVQRINTWLFEAGKVIVCCPHHVRAVGVRSRMPILS